MKLSLVRVLPFALALMLPLSFSSGALAEESAPKDGVAPTHKVAARGKKGAKGPKASKKAPKASKKAPKASKKAAK